MTWIEWLPREEFFAERDPPPKIAGVRAMSFAPIGEDALAALPTLPVRTPDEEEHAGEVDRWYLRIGGSLAHLTSYRPSHVDGADLVAFFEGPPPDVLQTLALVRALPPELARAISGIAGAPPFAGDVALRYVDAFGFSCPLVTALDERTATEALQAVRALGSTKRLYVGAPDDASSTWVAVRADTRSVVLRSAERVAALKLAAALSIKDECTIVVAPEDVARRTVERYRFARGALVETPEKLPGGDA